MATPGRLDDLISTGKLSLSQVRFLVLDECVSTEHEEFFFFKFSGKINIILCSFVPKDGLLSAGYTDFINRIHKQIPQVTSDGKRLQVLA